MHVLLHHSWDSLPLPVVCLLIVEGGHGMSWLVARAGGHRINLRGHGMTCGGQRRTNSRKAVILSVAFKAHTVLLCHERQLEGCLIDFKPSLCSILCMLETPPPPYQHWIPASPGVSWTRLSLKQQQHWEVVLFFFNCLYNIKVINYVAVNCNFKWLTEHT